MTSSLLWRNNDDVVMCSWLLEVPHLFLLGTGLLVTFSVLWFVMANDMYIDIPPSPHTLNHTHWTRARTRAQTHCIPYIKSYKFLHISYRNLTSLIFQHPFTEIDKCIVFCKGIPNITQIGEMDQYMDIGTHICQQHVHTYLLCVGNIVSEWLWCAILCQSGIDVVVLLHCLWWALIP